jgi:xanthine dehydrogenase iron-sulfur cluster and FAD-binding subunit A
MAISRSIPASGGRRRGDDREIGYRPEVFAMETAIPEENPAPTEEQAREAVSVNPCRCTGHQNIVASVLRAADLSREISERYCTSTWASTTTGEATRHRAAVQRPC